MKRHVARAGTALGALAVASAVLVAAPMNESDERPFIRQGQLGKDVGTRYADFRVERVLSAGSITDGDDTVVSTGTFLVVDVVVRAHHESFAMKGAQLRDREGRVFTYDEAVECAATVEAPVEVPWHVRYCFDVPRDALQGATLLLARGEWSTDDTDVRWDEVAEIDLGISAAEARELGKTDQALPGFAKGPYPLTDDELEPDDEAAPPVSVLEEEPE